MLNYRFLYSLYWNSTRSISKTLRSPGGFLVGGFLTLILTGALLLSLPFCHEGKPVSLVDNLFTSVSAVCVTGLVTVDPGTSFSHIGELVILLLIQIGGLGVMTYAAVGLQLFRQRLSLTSHQALEETLLRPEILFDLRRIFRQIVLVTLGIELTGALILFFAFLGELPPQSAAYQALFHAVSGFCNAGFSLWPDGLTRFGGSIPVMGTVMTLIVLGGLGHTVLLELWDEVKSPKTFQLSFHTKLVLVMSAGLILAGWFGIWLLGGGSWLESLFQSVSSRTAGFNTVEIRALPPAVLCLTCMLMAIGGSPGSCAGGLKTTTFAVWMSWIYAQLSGREDVTLLGRRLRPELVSRARLLVSLAIVWTAFGVLFLLAIEGTSIRFADAIFEQISAFGTVGLSTGITPTLSTGGKFWIMLTMFLGRLGPLTLAFWAFGTRRALVRFPEGKVVIG